MNLSRFALTDAQKNSVKNLQKQGMEAKAIAHAVGADLRAVQGFIMGSRPKKPAGDGTPPASLPKREGEDAPTVVPDAALLGKIIGLPFFGFSLFFGEPWALNDKEKASLGRSAASTMPMLPIAMIEPLANAVAPLEFILELCAILKKRLDMVSAQAKAQSTPPAPPAPTTQTPVAQTKPAPPVAEPEPAFVARTVPLPAKAEDFQPEPISSNGATGLPFRL